MSDPWNATLASESHRPPIDACPLSLSAPTVMRGPARDDGCVTYGVVARIALHRPGFGFRIEHDLPSGVELVEARPRATVVGDHLIWQLGRVDPGQELRLEVIVRLLPGNELSSEDVATFTGTYSQNLYFQAPIVRSRLTARISGPATADLGSSVEFVLDVANIGTWVADAVEATLTLSPEFDHPNGPEFAFSLDSLKPGEFRRVTVPARAIGRGNSVVQATVKGTDDRQATVQFTTLVA